MLFRHLLGILLFSALIILHSTLLSQSFEIQVINFKQLRPRLEASKTNDSVYVVNFWATWCSPCVEELPVFNQLSHVYAKQKLKILLVSLDMPDSLASLHNFVKKNALKPEIILLDEPDFDSWINKVSPSWQGSLPTTLIYRAGNYELFERQITFAEMKKKLDQMF